MDRALRMKPLLDFTRGPTFYPWPTVVPTRSFGIEFREFSHCASWVAFSCLEASVNDPFAKVWGITHSSSSSSDRQNLAFMDICSSLELFFLASTWLKTKCFTRTFHESPAGCLKWFISRIDRIEKQFFHIFFAIFSISGLVLRLQAKHLDRKHVVFGEIVREDGQVCKVWFTVYPRNGNTGRVVSQDCTYTVDESYAFSFSGGEWLLRCDSHAASWK